MNVERKEKGNREMRRERLEGRQWGLDPHRQTTDRQTQERKGWRSAKPAPVSHVTSGCCGLGQRHGQFWRTRATTVSFSAAPYWQFQQPSFSWRTWTVHPRAKQKSRRGQVTEAGHPTVSFSQQQKAQVLNWMNNPTVSWHFCVPASVP